MHEMSIAAAALESVLRVAAEHGADRVEKVELEIGAMKLVVPEALAMAWEVVTQGTAAQGCRLVTTESPMAARCRQCGREFPAAIDDFLCPSCGRADVDIVSGDDIILKSVTCQGPEGACRP